MVLNVLIKRKTRKYETPAVKGLIHFHLFLGGFIYAPSMRRRRYLTMLDPFQEKMGDSVVFCLYLTTLFADVLWSAAILSALGRHCSQPYTYIFLLRWNFVQRVNSIFFV